MAIEEFRDNDTAYQNWIQKHPEGFVINLFRDNNSFFTLHTSMCSLISQYNKVAKRGGFTERQYIKFCADSIQELHDWVIQNRRKDGHLKKCGRCNPSDNEDNNIQTKEGKYLPTRNDCERAIQKLKTSKLTDKINGEELLYCLENDLKKRGVDLNNNWRLITKKNFKIWFK
jgi:hypothetical protein